MFDNLSQEAAREMYFITWEKMQTNEPLEPIEQELKTIIEAHAEYHHYLANPEKYLAFDFNARGTNPFLHMSIHHALLEQLKTDRPKGLRNIYEKLLNKGLDSHAAEHEIMGVLAEMIWEALHNRIKPSDAVYLQKLQRLV